MLRVALVVAALALPALCRADQIWRWEDAAGRIHYSNVRSHVPAHAEPLAGTSGTLTEQPPPTTAPTDSEPTTPLTEPTR